MNATLIYQHGVCIGLWKSKPRFNADRSRFKISGNFTPSGDMRVLQQLYVGVPIKLKSGRIDVGFNHIHWRAKLTDLVYEGPLRGPKRKMVLKGKIIGKIIMVLGNGNA